MMRPTTSEPPPSGSPTPASGATGRSAARPSRLGALAEREFRLLFLGRLVSFLGNAVAPIALAFAVLDLTGSVSDLGLVLAARSIPQVLFLLAGGIWADRLPRHRVMVASSLASGASQGAVALLLLTHSARLWHLVALGALNGTASAFFFPASTGIVPQTVGTDSLQQANAVLRLALNATQIAGAALGGVLVATIGSGWTIAFDACAFALGAVFIGRMRVTGRDRLEGSDFLRELGEGWREFRSRTWLWAIVLQFSVVNAAAAGAMSVLGPLVAKRSLGGPAAWGLILAAEGAGLVLGSVVALRYRPQRMLLVGSLGVLFLAPPLFLLGLPAPALTIAAAAAASGLGVEIFSVLWDTAMQQNIPGDRLSRVSSWDALGSFVLIPVGVVSSGPIAEAVGVRETLWGAAALVLVATLGVLSVADVRNLRRAAPRESIPTPARAR